LDNSGNGTLLGPRPLPGRTGAVFLEVPAVAAFAPGTEDSDTGIRIGPPGQRTALNTGEGGDDCLVAVEDADEDEEVDFRAEDPDLLEAELVSLSEEGGDFFRPASTTAIEEPGLSSRLARFTIRRAGTVGAALRGAAGVANGCLETIWAKSAGG